MLGTQLKDSFTTSLKIHAIGQNYINVLDHFIEESMPKLSQENTIVWKSSMKRILAVDGHGL